MKAKKILLIEDDPTMRTLLSTLLEIEGYTPVVYKESHDQDNMLNFLQNELPDVILLDVHLKFANGLELLRSIRQINAFKNIKIILTSGMDYSSQWKEMGADSFLQKPYMPDELLNYLKEI